MFALEIASSPKQSLVWYFGCAPARNEQNLRARNWLFENHNIAQVRQS